MLIIIAYLIKRALIKREVHLCHYSGSVQLPLFNFFSYSHGAIVAYNYKNSIEHYLYIEIVFILIKTKFNN